MRARLEKGKVSSWYDPGLVAFLKKDDVDATVFVTGMFAELYPDLLRGLGDDPRFTIGDHTYDHAAFEAPCYGLPALADDARKKDEIVRTQAVLKALTGKTPTLFRYPGLCRSAQDDALVASLGLSVSDGTLVSGDAFSKDPGAIVRTVLAGVAPGAQIVMHLGGPNAQATTRAIETLVPALRAEGYRFGKL